MGEHTQRLESGGICRSCTCTHTLALELLLFRAVRGSRKKNGVGVVEGNDVIINGQYLELLCLKGVSMPHSKLDICQPF